MNRFPVENIDKVAASVNADNASKATQLANSKSIKLTGDVTGSASFNGTADASITATIKDDSHNHVISNIDGLQDALDSINESITSSVASAGTSLTVNGTKLQLKDSAGNVLSEVTTQDTDTKVTQTVSTTNAELPLLGKSAVAATTTTDTTKFAAGVTLNPSTNTITAAKFKFSNGAELWIA